MGQTASLAVLQGAMLQTLGNVAVGDGALVAQPERSKRDIADDGRPRDPMKTDIFSGYRICHRLELFHQSFSIGLRRYEVPVDHEVDLNAPWRVCRHNPLVGQGIPTEPSLAVPHPSIRLYLRTVLDYSQSSGLSREGYCGSSI